jgi:hypothetical protein
VGVREPTVVHGLENRVRVGVGVGGDLDEVHVLDEPVGEVRKRIAGELLRHVVFDVLEAVEDVDDRFRLAILGKGLAGEQGIHGRLALVHVEVEGPLPELLGEDQVGELAPLLAVVGLSVQMDEDQRQRREPLLPVDDELASVLVADDDRAEEVVAVVLDGAALVPRLVALGEFLGEVGDELVDLLALPTVFPLVVVDRELGTAEECPDALGVAPDFLHRIAAGGSGGDTESAGGEDPNSGSLTAAAGAP